MTHDSDSEEFNSQAGRETENYSSQAGHARELEFSGGACLRIRVLRHSRAPGSGNSQASHPVFQLII